jgi:glycosyltransferase involved in cell wall biosynthesis
LFAPRIAQEHELAISAFYGLEGARLDWEGIQVFPGLGGEYGNGCLVDHATRWFGDDPRGGVVMTLMDVWVLSPQMASQLNMASWVPVDHDPAPPAVRGFFANSGAIPIAMSRFGQEQLAEFDPLYVPHGVDLEEFKPHPRDQVRELTGVDKDDFLIGMVAANKGRPSRKSFQQALEAFAIFRRKHENAKLYLHTTVNPDFAQGEDLPALISSLQIPENSVLIADQYRQAYNPIPPKLMAKIYSSFDVLINPAQGEGFGVPILEAQACGVPAIVTNFSAMKEVCGAGWKVSAAPLWTGQRSWQAIPSVSDIIGALEECYSLSDAERAEMSRKARAHAEQYGVERVMEEHMLPALEECEARFDARKPTPLKVAA